MASGGDPTKTAKALLQRAGSREPPVRFADLIHPSVSVFRSDPKRGMKLKKTGQGYSPTSPTKSPLESHPHANVLRDFRRHHPFQADKVNVVQILATYR